MVRLLAYDYAALFLIWTKKSNHLQNFTPLSISTISYLFSTTKSCTNLEKLLQIFFAFTSYLEEKTIHIYFSIIEQIITFYLIKGIYSFIANKIVAFHIARL